MTLVELYKAGLVSRKEILKSADRPHERIVARAGDGFSFHMVDSALPDGIVANPDRLADRLHNMVEDLRCKYEPVVCEIRVSTAHQDGMVVIPHHGTSVGKFDTGFLERYISKPSQSRLEQIILRWLQYQETEVPYPAIDIVRRGISTWRPAGPLGILPFKKEKEIEWVKEETIPSRILEINNNTVILECLMDAEGHLFENRVFEKKLLEGVVDLELDRLVLIEVMSRKGEIRFLFKEGENFINPDIFAEPDYASKLENWND